MININQKTETREPCTQQCKCKLRDPFGKQYKAVMTNILVFNNNKQPIESRMLQLCQLVKKFFKNTKNKITIVLPMSLLSVFPKKFIRINGNKHLYKHVQYYNIIHDYQDTEATQVSITRKMDEYSAYKKH